MFLLILEENKENISSWLWGRWRFPEYIKGTNTREQVTNHTTLNVTSDYQKAPLRAGKPSQDSEKRYLQCT